MTKISFTIALCCCFLFMNNAMSQTKRYVKTIATGTGDGSSWANASSNLQGMLNASADNDEVWVAKGTYRPTTPFGYTASHVAYTDDRHKSFYLHSGVKLYGSFAGTEISTGQRKLALNKTYLSGDLLGNDGTGFSFTNNNENAYHVIVAISAHTIRVDGFTISGGNTTGMPATYLNDAPVYTQISADGAGIYSYDSDYYLTANIFLNNFSTAKGGAVYNRSINQTGDITGSIFINNRAAQGSVLYVLNAGADYAFSYLTNCTVFKNISGGATVFTESDRNRTNIYNTILQYNYGVGRAIDTNLINAVYSAVQTNSLLYPVDPGPDPLDPFFNDPLDPDGADNILGTSDDGIIPGCGPAIGGGVNLNLPVKDIRDAARIQNGTIDMGAYETPLIQQISSISITQTFSTDPYDNDDSNPYNDLPAPGLCEGGVTHFNSALSGNGGVFQWKKNGINVGTNSGSYNPTDLHANDQVKLTYISPPGCAAASTIESNVITVQNISSGKPVITSIIGSTNGCPFLNGAPVAYKVNKAPGAVVYYWYINGAGASIVSHPGGYGVNDTIVMVSFTQPFTTATINVAARNWCGYSSTKKLTIYSKIPQSAGTITGPTDLCPYIQSAANPAGTPATYTIRKVLDASSYAWTVPAGATITSHPGGAGFNDTIITVLYSGIFVSGAVTAQGINLCGSKAPRSLTVSKKNAGTPGTITGPTAVCAFKQSPSNPSGTPVDYKIKKTTYATSYSWTLPANVTATHPGGTGVNDTILRVTYGTGFAGGAITVKANTNCNTSAVRSLSIPYLLPYTPGTVTASAATACPQRRITYSLASLPNYATTVQWTVPASGTIISGQGTLSLVVEFGGPTSSTDSIRVVGVNDCGNSSSQRKLKVALLGACRAGKDGGENIPSAITKAPLPNNTNEFDVTAMPNPSQQQFNLVLTGKDYRTAVTIQVVNTSGRSVETRSNIQNNQTITLGNNWSPGVYIATLIQGSKKKTLRLVKL